MLGLSTHGPVAGGWWSLAQAAAMGNGASALALCSSVGVAAASVALPVAMAATFGEYAMAQTHTLDQAQPPTDPRSATPWILVWHNWIHGVHIRRFETLEGALECSRGGRRLRRMIVLVDPDGKEATNEHGQTNPWREVLFQGENVLVDNAMRRELRERLSSHA